jgi:hypothetical protein
MTRRLKDDDGDRVPGFWESLRQRHLAEIDRGDPRGLGLSLAERKKLDAHPNSSVSQARAALARMDEQGWAETWAPSRREFGEAVANIPWLNDVRVQLVLVFADDRVEPA